MLLRKTPDLTYADVTPKSVYLNRRNFLRAMGIAGAAALAGEGLKKFASPEIAHATTKLPGVTKGPYSTSEPETPYNDVTHYNNFYEFGTGKEDPATNAQNFKNFSLDRFASKARWKAAEAQHGRHHEDRSARGAHLPPPLRGGVVDRGAVDRLLR